MSKIFNFLTFILVVVVSLGHGQENDNGNSAEITKTVGNNTSDVADSSQQTSVVPAAAPQVDPQPNPVNPLSCPCSKAFADIIIGGLKRTEKLLANNNIYSVTLSSIFKEYHRFDPATERHQELEFWIDESFENLGFYNLTNDEIDKNFQEMNEFVSEVGDIVLNKGDATGTNGDQNKRTDKQQKQLLRLIQSFITMIDNEYITLYASIIKDWWRPQIDRIDNFFEFEDKTIYTPENVAKQAYFIIKSLDFFDQEKITELISVSISPWYKFFLRLEKYGDGGDDDLLSDMKLADLHGKIADQLSILEEAFTTGSEYLSLSEDVEQWFDKLDKLDDATMQLNSESARAESSSFGTDLYEDFKVLIQKDFSKFILSQVYRSIVYLKPENENIKFRDQPLIKSFTKKLSTFFKSEQYENFKKMVKYDFRNLHTYDFHTFGSRFRNLIKQVRVMIFCEEGQDLIKGIEEWFHYLEHSLSKEEFIARVSPIIEKNYLPGILKLVGENDNYENINSGKISSHTHTCQCKPIYGADIDGWTPVSKAMEEAKLDGLFELRKWAKSTPSDLDQDSSFVDTNDDETSGKSLLFWLIIISLAIFGGFSMYSYETLPIFNRLVDAIIDWLYPIFTVYHRGPGGNYSNDIEGLVIE